MTIKRIAGVVGLLAGAAFSAPSPAETYFGVELGSSEVKEFCTERSSSCDKSGSPWRVFGTNYITRNFGIEAGYIDLGHVNDKDAISDTKLEARAGELLALIAYRARSASIFAKVGGYYAGTKMTVVTGGSTSRTTESNAGLVYGLGAQVDVSSRFAVRGDWHRYAKVGGSSTGSDADIDAFLLGVVWKFR
jgi:OOP family OmpA-OmpF porin